MIKKIAAIIAAFFTMMLYASMPIMSYADTSEFDPVTLNADLSEANTPYNLFTDSHFTEDFGEPSNDKPYVVSMKYIYRTGSNKYAALTCTYKFSSTSDFSFNQTENGFSFSRISNLALVCKGIVYNYSNGSLSASATTVNAQYTSNIPNMATFDFTDGSFTLYEGLNPSTSNYYLSMDREHVLYSVWSNIGYSAPKQLSLGISFDPQLNGSVSRTSEFSGKSYTSDTLDMIISNNGDDCQFAWFIVPHGNSVQFPASLLVNNTGFIGSPTFAYVTDEWINTGVTASPNVLSPSVWHTLPKGYKNQFKHVPWSSIKLQKDVSYDVVVYATLIQDTENMAASPTWSMSQYTVSSDLSGVQEVYRSTFSITDPAEYKENNDGFEVHPWNPDIDNSGLFSSSSAFTDNEGNIFIRSQGSGNGNNIVSQGWGDTQFSANRSFQNVFGFLGTALTYFPSDWLAILSFGFTAIIIFFIVKVVAHS